MKREAQAPLSEEGLQALAHYMHALQQAEDLSAISLRDYLSDLRQFLAWRECSWHEAQEDRPFTPQKVAPPLLIHYRPYLQTASSLKPATLNRALISLKCYFVWATKKQIIQYDSTSMVKFVPKEVPAPRYLSDEEENTLVAVVNATGTLRDQTIITLFLHTGLRAQELCTLTRQQVHLNKRSGTLRIVGKRKKVRDVLLNEYLATFPQDCLYLFPSEKTQQALTGRALGHRISKYATQAQVVDVSPHDLRHRFGYRMAEVVPLHRLAQIMGHDTLDTPCSIFEEPSKICSRRWRESHGYKNFRGNQCVCSHKDCQKTGEGMMEKNITIFISYAHEDEDLCKALEKHLSLLKRQRFIDVWRDRDINAGTDWEQAISTHLNTAQIILLLISPDFMASEYCYSVEMRRAIERHQANEARVIPIILRPVDWEEAPFGQLQALPTNAAPIVSHKWRYQDEAFVDVVKGLRKVIIEEWKEQQQVREISPVSPTQPIHFVTNLEYNRFVQSLGLRGPRHWGPSGSRFSDSQGDTPVTWVSWDDAVAYCDWAGGCLPSTVCETPTENAGAAIVNATEIGEWHDAGTEQRKQVCDSHTSRLIAIVDRDVHMPNVGFRCDPVIPPSSPKWVFIGDGLCQIGTDVGKFSLLANAYDLPQYLRRPILRRLASSFNLRGFTISATCVTNEEFFEFTRQAGKAWPSHWQSKWLSYFGRPFPARLASRPVVNVSAENAEAYCIWLQARLPTWVEWERAASGPARRPYPWGADYSPVRCNSIESGRGSLAAVDEYLLGDSPEGVRQLCGNVAEWVLGPEGKYEIRGGSYRMPCELWGLAYAFQQPDIGFHAPDTGFRVVID